MRNAYLFYTKFYNFKSEKVDIGGIETYIANLSQLLIHLGIQPNVVQAGDNDAIIDINGIHVIQYKVDSFRKYEAVVKQKLLPNIDVDNDLFIFASDTMIFKHVSFRHSIAIQHGIYWDIPASNPKNIIVVLLSRAKLAYTYASKIKRVKKLVCVDYNFGNWYRALVERKALNMRVIPNFTQIAPIEKKPETINIIFARRLVTYRGTILFSNAIKRILNEYNNVAVTVAGSGPDRSLMEKILEGYKQIQFTEYASSESLRIHSDKHIAVIPTVGSEGTSLSLLEAMSSQCAVICTAVGGMTNIIIDGHNGLMISPNEDELYQAIKRLIDDSALRNKLALCGYQTVKDSFSQEKWNQLWKEIIGDTLE